MLKWQDEKLALEASNSFKIKKIKNNVEETVGQN